MARNTTRSRIIEMLRAEIRSSSNTSRGLDNLPYLEQLVSRHNETITDEYDWPYMTLAKADARKTLAAGQRYYDFPVKLNTESITKVWYQQTNDSQWIELTFGIGPEQYSEQDSDNDDRSDVIARWDFITDEDGEFQFEVWPMPESNGGLIWFEGGKKFSPMTDNQHRADHDDQLIVLRAAAEALTAKSKKDADIKAAAAGNRISVLKSRLSSKRKISVGGGAIYKPRGKTRVLVARSES
ncbi:MAG: hypothetical protein V4721_00455 [Bacteroidota bacterium]